VRIGRGVRIGAGALIVRDVPDGATVVGEPARVMAPGAQDPASLDALEAAIGPDGDRPLD
jgi:serine acetyltransferase